MAFIVKNAFILVWALLVAWRVCLSGDRFLDGQAR